MRSRIAYAHPDTNAGKLASLEALQEAYRDYTQACIDQMVTAQRHHVPLRDRQSFFRPAARLSSQLEKCARMQAVNAMSAWHATLWPRLKKRLYQTAHPPGFRTEVKLVALYRLTAPGRCGTVVVSEEAVALWWSWVWDPSVAGRTPVLRQDAPMWLSEMTIALEAPRRETGLAARWVRISCLTPGRRLRIPLVCDPKILTASRLAKSVLVGKRNGRWAFQFTEDTPEPTLEAGPDAKRVAVDVGKRVLAATSDGQLLDRRTGHQFNQRWAQLHRHRRNRQRLGAHLQALGRGDEATALLAHSDRLRRIERSLTGLVATAAGRVATRLAARHPGAVFVVEALNLRGCRGSKRFAYRALQRALARRAPILAVNPAYTSQTCRRCGHVSRKNRSGTSFRCSGCGFTSHADVNAAGNLLGRSEDKQVAADTHFTLVGVIARSRYRHRRDRAGRSASSAATVPPVGHCARDPAHSDAQGPLLRCSIAPDARL